MRLASIRPALAAIEPRRIAARQEPLSDAVTADDPQTITGHGAGHGLPDRPLVHSLGGLEVRMEEGQTQRLKFRQEAADEEVACQGELDLSRQELTDILSFVTKSGAMHDGEGPALAAFILKGIDEFVSDLVGKAALGKHVRQDRTAFGRGRFGTGKEQEGRDASRENTAVKPAS